MAVTFGEKIKIEIYGESHGQSVGVRISGIPAGKTIDMQRLQDFMRRRSPGKSVLSTSRVEDDVPVFISGAELIEKEQEAGEGDVYVTTGEILEAGIRNEDVRPEDYDNLRSIPRPSHADYPAWVKYGEIASGGGQFSGRMTAPLCVAGGIFIQWLEEIGININAHVESIGGINGEDMYVLIARMREEGDSVGGIIRCTITGVPAGVGSPIFGNIESRICQAVFAIPAIKGIEFGNGFDSAKLKGSENNDQFTIEDGKVVTKTNNHGGILGGLSTGMPIEFDVAVKPTPSIAKEQRSVDLETMTETVIKVAGRHDPCIVPRAVPCIEAAAAIAIGDILLDEGLMETAAAPAEHPVEEHSDLVDYRREIDRIDKELVALLEERFDAARDVIRYKALKGIPIRDSAREKEVLDSISSLCREDTLPYMKNNFEQIIAESRRFQAEQRAEYGLLGEGLTHSYSPQVHGMLGGYDFALFDVPERDLDEFMEAKRFKGLSVTMPYKKSVMPYCDEISDCAKKCGCVNTIVVQEDGRLFGDNTDYAGFKYTVEKSGIDIKDAKVIIMGTGGASGTVINVLCDLGAGEIINISRRGDNNYENIKRHADAEIIVNATPVGMFPEAGKSLVNLEDFPSCRAVFDIIYNPLKTKLMLDAERLGIPAFGGIDMLVRQAAEACRIFTGREVPDEKTEEVLQKLRYELENVVLIGMPGCGKTSVGRELAQRLGKDFADVDERIKESTGRTPEQLITEEGLAVFRQIETDVLSEIVRSGKGGCIISAGGGIVERDINRELLRENGKVIYLKRSLDQLPIENRPVSQAVDLKELYERRHSKYELWSDIIIENNSVHETVNIVEQMVCI